MSLRVLRLDKTGVPVAWISKEAAVTLMVKESVIWSLSDDAFVMRGGYNRLGKRTLFRRDDHFCMYCGDQYIDRQLTRDHVIPVSQGGQNKWNNVVAACQRCNNHKGGRTPEQANMQLLAIPFTPNLFEFMYLSNRLIVSDQMEYLRARFKSNYRQWQVA